MLDRRLALDGSLPRRVVRTKRKLELPGQGGVRGGARRLGQAGGVHHHRVHPAAAQPLPRREVRPPRGADHPRRGPHLRHGLAVQGVRDLRVAGPDVRARRPRAAAVLQGEPAGPDPRGGHHRGRLDGQLHRRRHQLRHPRRADGAVLHLLFDVRLAAGRRPHLAGQRRTGPRLPARRHRRSHHAARRGPAAPGRPQPAAGVGQPGHRGLRPGVRLRGGHDRPPRPAPHVARERGRHLLPHALQREPGDAGDARRRRQGRDRGPLPLGGGARRAEAPRHDPVLRLGQPRRPGGAERAARALRRGRRAVVGHQLQAAPRAGAHHRALEPPPPRPGGADAARHRAARRR